MDIKEKLSELRKSMTLVEIAKAIGVNRATVVRAQRGNVVSLKTYLGVCGLIEKRRNKPKRVKKEPTCQP